MIACNKYCGYRGYWNKPAWYSGSRWWPITAKWNSYCYARWGPISANIARQNFINEREPIEAKIEATPWTNQLDLIVGSLENRPGAAYVPNSIWSSATESNELGRNRMGAIERRDAQLPYEFNNQWGATAAHLDDSSPWSSATQSNELGRERGYYVESLFTPGNI